MKFSLSTKSKIKTKKTILFVCVQNAGRSQMAEGFFRKYAPEGFEPVRAGTKPTSQINPLAIQVINEIGIDISKQKSKDNGLIEYEGGRQTYRTTEKGMRLLDIYEKMHELAPPLTTTAENRFVSIGGH